MTFLELATEIDTEKKLLEEYRLTLNAAVMQMESCKEAFNDQQARVTALMKDMKEMLGFSHPTMDTSNMKELALEGQKMRTPFKR